ncbi:MAG: hypothetical protein H7336_03235 [Bacteriovorax sp.]|nr:hypothetical protein [Bacteriovorax sp.]
MKVLLIISLLATTAALASTNKAAVKRATETKTVSLQEIAETAQTTSTHLEKENETDKSAVLSVDNTGRLNTKEDKLSAENKKATTIKK